MPPNAKPLVFARSGSIPVVDVKVKFPHLGSYDVTRWNTSGGSPKSVGRGNTLDSIQDTFRVVQTRDEFEKLNAHFVTWVIWIQRTVPGSQAPWEYRLDFWQGDQLVEREAKTGTMDSDFKSFRGIYEIRLV